MKTKRIVIISAAVAAVAAGSAGAVAATKDDGKKTEQAVLDDAAKRLNVSPSDLRSALGAAEDAQLDQAVKDGRLTQAQADELKARRGRDGRVLGFGHGRGHGPGFGPGPGGVLEPAAKALGLSTQELMTQLRSGKSLADVAKAQNKDLADVKAAVKASLTARLDAAVKAGQRKEELAELDEHIDRIGDGPPGRFGRHGRHGAGDREGLPLRLSSPRG